MQVPVQVLFRNMAPSPAVEEKIRERAAKLDRYYDRITACRVVVETPHRHQHQGRGYRIRVDLTVPDGEILADSGHGEDPAHEDIYVAIRSAFDAARRSLEDFARRQRGEVKHHTARPGRGESPM
jgi:ribosomal subunit interface protein